MAVTAIPVTKIVRAGIELLGLGTDVSHATDGISFPNDGRTFLYIENQAANVIVLTVITQQIVVALAVADLAFTIGASKDYVIGPFPREAFNVKSGANIGLTLATTDGNGEDLAIFAFRL